MSGGDWMLVLEWDHPYEGALIEQSVSGLRIVIPFMDRPSAQTAQNEMRTRIYQEKPVIQGTLIAGEIEDQR